MAKPAPLTSLETFVQDRVSRDTGFAAALMEEALQSMLDGDINIARGHLRDVIKGSLGYGELSTRTDIPAKSLIRMFGPNGNPTLGNVAAVLQVLQHCTGVRLKVSGVPVVSGARKQAARQPKATYMVAAAVSSQRKPSASSSRRKLSPSSSRRKPGSTGGGRKKRQT